MNRQTIQFAILTTILAIISYEIQDSNGVILPIIGLIFSFIGLFISLMKGEL